MPRPSICAMAWLAETEDSSTISASAAIRYRAPALRTQASTAIRRAADILTKLACAKSACSTAETGTPSVDVRTAICMAAMPSSTSASASAASDR